MKLKLNQFINRHPYFFGAITLALLTLIIYGDVVFGPSNIVLSRQGTDLSTGIYNLQFSFSQLRQGNFPLWNPHLLSGYPWFASFQTLMLYPPAWMFLILPVGKGVNVFVVFHIFLLGFGMFSWLKQRDLHPLSCILGAALLIFGSTVTMQIYAGHLTPLASMAWMPFIFMAVDGCFNRNYRLRWIMTGTLCVALQIMAGFPQHVYYTALLAGIYVLGRVVLLTPATLLERPKVLLSVAAIYLWACGICAIQLFATFAATAETARHGKLPFNFAASYSFPFENILTLLAPKILGDQMHLAYWGRWDMWEMLFYIGIAGLILALIGIRSATKEQRLIILSIITITCLISLGKYTPFYTFVYNYLPGFGSFRVNSRILFEGSFFLITLSAIGFDALLKSQYNLIHIKKLVVFAFVSTGLFTIGALILHWQSLPGNGNTLKALLTFIPRSRQQYLEPSYYQNLQNIHQIASFASTQLLIAAITFLLIGLLFLKFKQSKRGIYAIGFIAAFEVLFFTATMRPTFNVNTIQYPTLKSFLTAHHGNNRFLKWPMDNWAASLPLNLSGGDISGYESFRLLRYDQFVLYAQGINDKDIFPILPFNKTSPLFALLRCKYIFKDGKISKAHTAPLPHLLLIPKWQIEERKEKVLSGLHSPSFNPRTSVYLESTPQFDSSQNSITKPNKAIITNQSTDWMDITASVRQNSILLVTDSYSKDWKVFPYHDSSQQKYEVMPADYALRGIPLSPGYHHFRLKYAPDAFSLGMKITLASLLFFLLLATYSLAKQLKRYQLIPCKLKS